MMETKIFMYIRLNYSDKNNHAEIIPVAKESIDHPVSVACESLASDKLHLILF